MSIKVAINGFGRIGRLALRQIEKAKGIEVVAVNDLTPAEMLLHLFKYDSTQGRFQGTAELKDDAIVVNGKEIKVFANPNPEELPWGRIGRRRRPRMYRLLYQQNQSRSPHPRRCAQSRYFRPRRQ